MIMSASTMMMMSSRGSVRVIQSSTATGLLMPLQTQKVEYVQEVRGKKLQFLHATQIININ